MTHPMIQSDEVTFSYNTPAGEGENAAKEKESSRGMALRGVSLEIQKGDFVVILGHNGSGKSTFAKTLNALLFPTGGSLFVDAMRTSEEENIWRVRQSAGMIFQNPDNQMVASIIEEDVAFGPENLGVEPQEIRLRVTEALEAVEMGAFAKGSPVRLSGGQKQRIAIAGVLAMRPKCLVLDEPTAMLDPRGRGEVMKTLHRLNEEEGMTVIHITHFMEEAVHADYVYVMDQGKIALQGTPREVFSKVKEVKALGLDIPSVTELAFELSKEGYTLPGDLLYTHEMVEALCRLKSKM